MDESIVSLIAQAEKEAASRKEAAELQAAQIVAAAEKKSMEIAKESEAALKALREQTLQNTEEQASQEYRIALDKARSEAKDYADAILSRADNAVLEIVGRILK